MRKNCQLYSARELWETIYNYEKRYPARIWLDKDCYLHWKWSKRGQTETIDPYECACNICMPLWEVVMVDEGGFDEYAVLYYEN